ncbi:hypothetical protein LIPSTDRAFT_69443 [Lipomyces starkeyi NRRL Y-11557]|uniref:Uncharacterized protein n=1 Tax=Lipomyces starkeyi NRRL Y-11557 TaxID=675824 RepID=A0A1E3QDT5_LIPST|nr:hypothetical protein LIPSTDRAFT_69443 [Lipomyces starkeyi NRRL Y-11557]
MQFHAKYSHANQAAHPLQSAAPTYVSSAATSQNRSSSHYTQESNTHSFIPRQLTANRNVRHDSNLSVSRKATKFLEKVLSEGQSATCFGKLVASSRPLCCARMSPKSWATNLAAFHFIPVDFFRSDQCAAFCGFVSAVICGILSLSPLSEGKFVRDVLKSMRNTSNNFSD